jgi:predicted nucleic acid-binding protein
VPDDTEVIVLGDSSLLVTYLGADLHDTLLIPVCQAETWHLAVPHKVGEELARKLPQISRRAMRNWEWLISNAHVEVLEKVAVGQGSQVVLKKVATLLEVKLTDLRQIKKNEGEAYVVAHAIEIANSGRLVKVAIDDAGGREWAAAANLAIITTESILGLAIERGIINNVSSLTSHYSVLQSHGHLPSLSSTGLDTKCLSAYAH